MRKLKILAIICFMGLLLQIYAHINLMVSYKYEVDIMKTNIKFSEASIKEKEQRLHRVDVRSQEIADQQKSTTIYFWVFLLGLVISSYFIISRRKIEQ